MPQSFLTSARVSLFIRLASAIQRSVGVGIGFGLSVFDRARCWLVVKLCAHRLRRGGSVNRIRSRELDLRLQAANVCGAWPCLGPSAFSR